MIKRIYIEHFGGIQDREIVLGSGLNVIYGENEAGKTTIQAFIKAMLYGMETSRKNDVRNIPRKRYMPKNRDIMGGTLEIDNYLIMRTFGKTQKQDVCTVIDRSTGDKVVCENIGEKILGVSEETFSNTLFIEQFNSYITSNNEIATRLANLNQTTNETISYDGVMGTLNNKVKLLSNPKSKNSIIQSLETDISELSLKIENEQNYQKLIIQKQKEYDDLKQGIIKITARQKILESNKLLIENYEVYCNAKKSKDEYDDLKQKLDDIQKELYKCENDINISSDVYDKALKLNKECERLNIEISGKKGHKNKIILFMSIAFGLIGLLFLLAFINPAFLAFLISFVPMSICVKVYLDTKKQNVAINEKNKRTKSIELELEKIYISANVSSFDEFVLKYETQKSKMICAESLQTQYNMIFSIAEKKHLDVLNYKNVAKYEKPTTNMSISQINIEYENNNKQIIDENKRLAQLEYEIKQHIPKRMEQLESQLSIIKNKYAEAQKELLCINVAKDVLAEAYLELKSDFSPQLNNSIAEVFSVITNQKYDNIIVSEGFDAIVTKKSEAMESVYLSNGTIDAVYFSVRLGIIKLIYKNNNIFMIMDDAFIQYDDKRVAKALDVLAKMSTTMQIIYFTCQSRIEKQNNNINLIKI